VVRGRDGGRGVEAVKLQAIGRGGLAVGTRAAGYDYRGSLGAFTEVANEQSLICAQIEDEAAVHNIDEILRVDGIDVFFIGPSDLSQSMGYPGNPRAEPVAQAIEAVLKKILAAGKTAGMPATTDNVAQTVARGVRYIYTHATTLLATSAAAYLQAGKALPAGKRAQKA